MPRLFVQGFHDGGQGTALPINLGYGARRRNPAAAGDIGDGSGGGEWVAEYLASDMFTCLANVRSRCGVVLGYLSQRQQFGCFAANAEYDRLTAQVSGDGVLLPPGSCFQTGDGVRGSGG